jgi:hypothetical protein
MQRWLLVPIVALLVGGSSTALAQEPGSSAPTNGADGCRILSPGCRSVEWFVQYFVEAWTFNDHRWVTLPGNTAVISGSRGKGWGVALEVLDTSVKQAPRDAFVTGLSLMLRRRLVDYRRMVLFADGGLGASYATAIVPRRGTRFNYLVQGGLGIAIHLGPQVGAMVSLRWFHLSNGSLNGSSHNPDIQALGGRVGMFVTF